MKTPLLLGSFLLLLLIPPALAQEDDEEARELAAELRRAEGEKASLTARLQTVNKRLELLRKIQSIHRELRSLDEKIEAAEENDDEDLIERLEEQFEPLEEQLEQAYQYMELFRQQSQWREMLDEVREEAPQHLAQEAQRLLEMQQRRIEQTGRLFKIRNENPEADVEELQGEIEELGEHIELRAERLGLRWELHIAREEGEEEAVRELEAELEELQGDEPAEQDGEDEPDDDPTVMVAPPKSPLARPISLSEQQITAAGKLSLQSKIVPLLKTYCYECHDSASASGDLDLEKLLQDRPLVVHRQDWLNVIQQLKVRSMPPVDAKQPDDSQRTQMAAWLTHAIERFDYSTVRQPGYEPARRLTHEEYNNTIRDLFGVDLRPADRFPADLSANSGFANSANSLFIQPILMERYINAAEEILQQALPIPPAASKARQAWRRLFSAESPQKSIALFASRAFRRKTTAEEVAALSAHYDRLRQADRTPQQAFRETLQVVLVSPSFLLRHEMDRDQPPGQPFPISNYELASRLSYFLWATMPDDRLFRLASEGVLGKPEVLRAEVERMLKDPKADTLGTQFASQWLGFNSLNRVRPGPIDNPWATDGLIRAMEDESAMFFTSLVRENAPVERLLTADYTYLNEELAKHYRMSGVQGEQMRRVSLQGTPRGGILGQGSILAITSFPGRTSPVVRGNWILSELLGTPPPPPPPNASQFDEEIRERDLSPRKKLELHRRNPNCYACHHQIDPLGFSLERFDWFGRYRSGRRIDDVGEFPGGKKFSGLNGLRKVLLEERRGDLVEQVCRKMFAYALGRQLEYYDEAAIREIVSQVEADQRRMQTLIKAIVGSETFQQKQKGQP